MLQSIQFNGSGPPTYVYSPKVEDASNEFYHVFAAQMRGHQQREEHKYDESVLRKKTVTYEVAEQEDVQIQAQRKMGNLQEIYQKEYGRRESFLWRQR